VILPALADALLLSINMLPVALAGVDSTVPSYIEYTVIGIEYRV
jgi:hypothetical protein